jgi:hypothetical protein
VEHAVAKNHVECAYVVVEDEGTGVVLLERLKTRLCFDICLCCVHINARLYGIAKPTWPSRKSVLCPLPFLLTSLITNGSFLKGNLFTSIYFVGIFIVNNI